MLRECRLGFVAYAGLCSVLASPRRSRLVEATRHPRQPRGPRVVGMARRCIRNHARRAMALICGAPIRGRRIFRWSTRLITMATTRFGVRLQTVLVNTTGTSAICPPWKVSRRQTWMRSSPSYADSKTQTVSKLTHHRRKNTPHSRLECVGEHVVVGARGRAEFPAPCSGEDN